MPRYYARLEAADGSGEFRFVTLHAESEEAAREILERRERAYSDYRLATNDIPALLAKVTGEDENPDATLKDLEKAVKDALKAERAVHPDARAALALHQQAEPYEIVWLGDSREPPKPARTTGGGEAE